MKEDIGGGIKGVWVKVTPRLKAIPLNTGGIKKGGVNNHGGINHRGI